MNGLINLLKPAAMSSNDCVMNLRRFSGEKKTGHGGTLDPNAAGVLPIALGKATRLIEYMESAGKEYFCKCRFGFESDTQDIWGEVRSTGAAMPSEEAVRAALKGFEGDILQLPPKYSALKVNGKRAYDLARAGAEFSLEPRRVTIRSIKLVSYSEESGELCFSMACSRGTYVRTICADLGERLGAGAVMSFLLRTASGGFGLADAVTLEELAEGPEAVERHLQPMEQAVKSLKRVDTPSEERTKAFMNGLSFYKNACDEYTEGEICAVYGQSSFLGTAKASLQGDRTVFIPEKVIG